MQYIGTYMESSMLLNIFFSISFLGKEYALSSFKKSFINLCNLAIQNNINVNKIQDISYALKFFWNHNTGGSRISWFLVPNGNHEMRGSWIPRTVFSVKPHNGYKKIWKFTFLSLFFPIQIAFSSLYAYWISWNCHV